ncbi:MAG: ComF family protein [Bacteroidales bacterium]|nr:ComF family protein [Bacteroidales bacterium]NLK80872.1 ComF family protein [Bacteroidales bacterium]
MIRTFFARFLFGFFPDICTVCGSHLRVSERVMCTSCLIDIPRIYFHNQERNPLEDVLWGQIPYEKATALFYYTKKNKYAALLHNLKYKNRSDVGEFLGELFANELQKTGFLDSIDCIIPIPLHKKRLKQRGYNQSEHIALGLSKQSSIPYITNAVVRTVNTQTQTKKSKEERLRNVQNIFSVINPSVLAHKHVLLLDDVITTGATCISCADTIISAEPSCRVSIASLGLVM